ncbi:MAG: LPS assembly lipoprotein LptE [Bacteroidia bacterium]
MKKYLSFFCLIWIILFVPGCISYTLSGAQIDPSIQTVSVETFPNQAALTIPAVSQTFSEKLKNKFIRETQLGVVRNNGDMQFSGAITRIYTNPVAIQGNTTASLTRFTMEVNVIFVNTKNEKESFEQNFSAFSDYDSRQNLQQVQDALVEEVTDIIVQEIFNKAVINW